MQGMKIKIQAQPKPVETGLFHFGNIESPYEANTVYFTKDGIPILPIAGEFHFSRYPRSDWRKELLKMKDAGITVISTYVFWNYHEEQKGVFDFEGDKNIAAFLQICKELALPCILRIGPWCHGEVIRGGFPKRIHRMPRKRCDYPKYLKEAEDFFRGLYPQVAPFMDGRTVIGIQLENEHGNISHIHTLRDIVEKLDYKTPFFTMTVWPANTPDPYFLPMTGGYPEAPWTNHKRPLRAKARFAITPNRTEAEIGEDLQKSKAAAAGSFDSYPYAACETGPGNQVTQHRRPVISAKDGYGVGFARFASGMNWLGYYMYHGGRNPNYTMLQENRRTGYPNNYPIIDYDFQAPISRYGECRAHGDLLRLMHLFINHFDDKMACKQAFFPNMQKKGFEDTSFPSCSVRMDASMSGYFFVSAYERGLAYPDFHDVSVTVEQGRASITLPAITVKSGAMFFYPFRLELAGTLFDYILAQPVAKVLEGDTLRCYFVQCEGVAPSLCVRGEVISLPLDKVGYTVESGGTKLEITVLSPEQAKTFHMIAGKPVFAKGTVYQDDKNAVCETTDGYLQCGAQRVTAQAVDLMDFVHLSSCGPQKLPYNHYLYSAGKRHYFSLTIDPSLLERYDDVRLEFDFTGLNLQVFSGGRLINDYFNTDGHFVMYLKEYASAIKADPVLVIKAVPATRYGVGHVYHEINMPVGKVQLRLIQALAVQTLMLPVADEGLDTIGENPVAMQCAE